jgi:phosphoglycolate phosphatase
MPIHAVIFDLDGTLLDTLEDIAVAFNRALRSEGLPAVSVGECRRRVGWGLRELVRRTVPEDPRDRDLHDRIMDQFVAAYRRYPAVHTRAYPGVQTLLTRLGNATIKTAVLSNKPDDLVQVVVREILGYHRFDCVLGARPDRPLKPDPASTREILRTLAVSPEECLFVGDSDVDIRTARNAGCVPVGVGWGFRDEDLLREAGAVHICYSTNEIRELLGLEEQREELG